MLRYLLAFQLFTSDGQVDIQISIYREETEMVIQYLSYQHRDDIVANRLHEVI